MTRVFALSNQKRFLYGGNVRANGIRQHFLRYGDTGVPLIIVPGITSPAITWGFVAERLSNAHCVYVLDARGRGLSEGGSQLEYGLDAYADDVAAFAETQDLKDYIVLGHSMGARTAARIGTRHADGPSRLILADPPLSGPGRRPYDKTVQFYMSTLIEAKAGRLDFEVMRRNYPLWKEEQLRLRAEWLHTCDEKAIRESVRGFQEEEIHSDLSAIRVPTLLVVAGKGGVINDDDLIEVRRIMPSIVVKKVERSGHMIPFEDLDGFLAALEGFI